MIEYKADPIIEKVLNRIKSRADKGIIKYAMSMEENPGDVVYWLRHLQEEMLDGAAYIERLISEIEMGA